MREWTGPTASPTGPRRVGTLLGVPLRVSPMSAVTAALLTYGFTGSFSAWMGPGAGTAAHLAMGFLGYLGTMACLLAHEYGHVLTARAFGTGTVVVTLTPFGMLATMERNARGPAEDLLVAAAGPAVSIALAALAFALMVLPVGEVVGLQARLLFYVNAGIAIFNLIPNYPMDGGRIVRALAWFATGNVARATRVAALVGLLGGLLVVALGALQMYGGNPLGALTVAVAFMMVTYAWRESRSLREEEFVRTVTARDLMAPFGTGDATNPTGVTLVPGIDRAAGSAQAVVWDQGREVRRLPAFELGQVVPGDDLNAVMEAFSRQPRGTWPILIVADASGPVGYVTQGAVMGRLS